MLLLLILDNFCIFFGASVLTDGAEDAQVASPPAEIFNGHKISQVHPLNGPEEVGLEAMDMGGKGLTESPCLGAV